MRNIISAMLGLLLAGSGAIAGDSQTQLLAQPIIDHGGTESWGEGVEFKIVDVPFLNWYFQGKPAYRGIGQTNQILTDAPREVREPESNLLAAMEITIGYDSETGKLWLGLESARPMEGWETTVEEAAYAALECIRIVAQRYKDRPKVIIRPPAGSEAKWKAVEERFSKHDLSKPFEMPIPKAKVRKKE